jgi:hypothetical protein
MDLSSISIWIEILGSEMTLNYRMAMEGHPNANEGVGNLILNYGFFFLLDGKKSRPHPTPRGSLSRVG